MHYPHQDASECSGPVGGPGSDGWRREDTTSTPSIAAPGDRRSPTARRLVGSDAKNPSPRTSSREDTCHFVITDHCPFFGVGALFFFRSWTPLERNRTGRDGHQPQKRPGPDPKHQPQAGNRNRNPERRPRKLTLVGSNCETFL